MMGDKLKGSLPPNWLSKMCLIRNEQAKSWMEKSQLLIAAGIPVNAAWYTCMKRVMIVVLTTVIGLLWIGRDQLRQLASVHPFVWITIAVAIEALMLCDSLLLHSLKRYRVNRMVEEIFSVSRQLLYFSGSSLNLHGKLTRCLPYTRLIRDEWHMLLNEWYYDPETAVNRLRSRLGTEEAYCFSETLQHMRLNDTDEYYDLLRLRVQNYKEKLEMIRDSRKESASYLLFVMAAIPIMYTFQIFIHPWVQEGQKLFESLN